MSRRPWLVALLVLAAYGCASMPWECTPGDARLQCLPELGPAQREARWGW